MKSVIRLMVALSLCSAAFAAPPRLTVAIWDYVGLSDSVVLPAVEFARRAFEDAGMDAVWKVCRAAREECPLPEDGRYLAMMIMPKMLTPLAGTAGETAGLAMIDGQPRAWAFYDVVSTTASKANRPVQLVLGCILVHEIAHVLGLPHRADGIMRANLTPRDLDAAKVGRIFDSLEARQLTVGAGRLVDQMNHTYLAVAGH